MIFDLLLAGLAGLVVSVLFNASLARRVWNLQCDLAATQAQLLRERNQRASLARSKDKEALEVLGEMRGPVSPAKTINPLAKFGVGR
jgi:hypothetical protein